MMIDRCKRRGVSLMMVTAVVAVASVLGLAILSSSTLQAEASANHDQSAHADGLAESGINLGLYYLQNLNDAAKCPMPVLANPGGIYTKTGQSLGAAVPGTFDLTVKRLSGNQYTLTATGNATATWGTVQRTLTATVDVNYFPYALSATNASTLFGSTLPAATTILGDVYTNGPLVNNASVSGSLYAGGLLQGLIKSIIGIIVTLIPTPANVNHYPNYFYNNVKYTPPTILLVTDIPAQPNLTTNPGGVYLVNGSLTLNGNAIKGTLVLGSSGSLKVSGVGNSITPVPGFPALVADVDISFQASNATLDLNGLTYIGGKVTRAGAYTGTKLNVTGGLLYGGTSTISLDANVAVKITYDRAKASVPGLVPSGNPQPTSVTIVSWKN